MNFHPCGHCSMCRFGQPQQCAFPAILRDQLDHNAPRNSVIDTGGGKVFSTVSASQIAQPIAPPKKGKKEKKEKKTTWESCYKSHPPLKITDTITVYGGSGSNPLNKACDIYVSLDESSRPDSSVLIYPWEGTPPVFILFPIRDMSVPKSPEEFKKMVGWLKEQAQAGKKIHVGCLGGHGRTGMLLAALVKEITGNEDAITFVRENYCKKVVETSSQVDFLHKEFGIKKVDGYKMSTWPASASGISWGGSGNSSGAFNEYYYGASRREPAETQAEKFNRKYGKNSDDAAYPVKSVTSAKGNIWGV